MEEDQEPADNEEEVQEPYISLNFAVLVEEENKLDSVESITEQKTELKQQAAFSEEENLPELNIAEKPEVYEEAVKHVRQGIMNLLNVNPRSLTFFVSC